MNPNAARPITATDVWHYFRCPHWPYWDRFGDPADKRPYSATEERRLQEGLNHEAELIKSMFPGVDEVSIDQKDGVERTRELMRQGVEVIYQGQLFDESRNWFGRPDLLEKKPGRSVFGDWMYVPVDIKSTHELKKEHKAQLLFYSVLLEHEQGVFPAHPSIINAHRERLPFDAAAELSGFFELMAKVERICGGECPDPVYRKDCLENAPWGKACRRLAEQNHDIALLYHVSTKQLEALRSVGVRTLEQAIEMKPEELEGQAPGLTLKALQFVQRQANSLQTKNVTIRHPWTHETVGLEIHFDIESQNNETDYLFGFWIGSFDQGEYKAFVAETPDQEKTMWKSFLAWLETLPAEYTVYHYAVYERSRLKLLSERYGDEENPWLLKFQDRLVDLKQLAHDTIVLPLHFYSLKDIGSFLGFKRHGEIKGGGQSVLAYEEWLESKDRHIFDSILEYNREDVQATAFLLRWLNRYAKEEKEYEEPYPWIPEATDLR